MPDGVPFPSLHTGSEAPRNKGRGPDPVTTRARKLPFPVRLAIGYNQSTILTSFLVPSRSDGRLGNISRNTCSDVYRAP
jgi:hypothetical protein